MRFGAKARGVPVFPLLEPLCRSGHAAALVAALLGIATGTACKGRGDKSGLESSVSSITTTRGAELFLEPPSAPGAVETVDVEGDRAAIVVVGDGDKAKRPIVHLHGTCAVARTNVESWASVARAHGSIVALEGDTACPDGIGGRTWRADPAAIEQRIDAALDAVRAVRGVPLERDQVVIVADDIGAMSALALAARAPARFSRLVLNALPDAAPAYELQGVKAVAVLATDREPQDKARRSSEALSAAKIASRLWTLPGATHSDYGLSGARIIGDALAFVSQPSL